MEILMTTCTNCGGELIKKEGHLLCQSCGSKFYTSQVDSKMFVDLRQAENERQSANFSKAKTILVKMLQDYFNEDLSDVYWNLLLCSQYIIFERDGKGEQFPAFYNINSKSIFEQTEYKKALEQANKNNNPEKAEIYKNLAEKIDKAKKVYEDISKTTPPFDVFICFKSTDANGNATKDKQLATDIYNELNGKYKVFFSEKTLQNIKSSYRDYEPNIYYGLYTSKVMLLICSQKEYLESTWLKNEWTRFGKMNSSSQKVIIPIFTDGFNPSELPEELWHNQGIKDDIKLISTLQGQLKTLIKKDGDKPKKVSPKKLAIIGSCVLVALGLLVGGLLMMFSAPMNYSKLSDGTYMIESSKKDETNIVIDAEYNKKQVTAIGERAFNDNKNMESLTIPSSISLIKNSAFEGCEKLTKVYYNGDFSSWCNIIFENMYSNPMVYADEFYIMNENQFVQVTDIVIPENVTQINNFAFYNFSFAKSFTLPQNLSSVGEYAFYNCTGLTELHIPKSVNHMGFSALDGCKNLQELSLAFVGENKNNSKNAYIGYTFGANEVKNNNLYVPSKLKVLNILGGDIYTKGLYNCKYLAQINMQNDVVNIGEDAFYDCSSVRKITLSTSTVSVGDSAFNGPTDFVLNYDGTHSDYLKINFADSDANPLVNASIVYMNNQNMMELTTIEIDNTITEIPDFAFYKFGIENLVIPSNIKRIGEYAFSKCPNLKTITMTNSVEYLEDGCFSKLPNLEQITLSESIESLGYGVFANCPKLESITLPRNLKVIPQQAFSGCTSLKNINISENLEYIETNALENIAIEYNVYENCNYIGNEQNPYVALISVIDSEAENLTIHPDTKIIYSNAFTFLKVKNLVIPNKVTYIGERAFYFSYMESITLSNSLKIIEKNAFNSCFKLQTVDMPSTVTKIGEGAFEQCNGLQSITLSSNLTEIPYRAFYYCNSLQNLVIPNNVTIIGDYAISYCMAMESLTLPKNLQSFGYKNFDNTSPLNIYYGNSISGWAKIDFADFNFPYTEAHLWINGTDYYNQATITLSDVEKIGKYAFCNFKNLRTINLPNNLKEIGDYAFANTQKLININLPSKLESIGAYAFAVSGINQIVIPESVTYIGAYAFGGCTALFDIEIKDTSNWYYYTSEVSTNGKAFTFESSSKNAIYLTGQESKYYFRKKVS